MKQFNVITTPRKPAIWLAACGLLFTIFVFIDSQFTHHLVQSNQNLTALYALLACIFFSCSLGVFYRRVVSIDTSAKTVISYHRIVIPLFKKHHHFEELSSVYVREEHLKGTSADLSQQTNKRFYSPIFTIYIDLKGWGKGKRRLKVKSFANRKEANLLVDQITQLLVAN